MPTILCPVDFSARSEAALRAAASLASPAQEELIVLHVFHCDPPPYFTHGQMDELEKEKEDTERGELKRLREFAVRVLGPAGGRVQLLIREGPTPETILNVAQEYSAERIVLGAHEHFGSTAREVARLSPVPVLTVPPGPA